MLIFPAIDILDGQVVRLYQGDYAQKEVFGSDPISFAAGFEEKGATCLHVVDLDGAKKGSRHNFSVVENLVRQTGLFVELGGGIRTQQAVEQCLEVGVGRVILGTAALRQPEFVKQMARRYPKQIAVGVDARDGRVAVDGWLDTTDVDGIAFCHQMRDAGVEYIIYTDIAKDGAQGGTNVELYRQLAQIEGLHITASGGISSVEDITALCGLGLYAAIVGKAMYTGMLPLEKALAAAKNEEGTP